MSGRDMIEVQRSPGAEPVSPAGLGAIDSELQALLRAGSVGPRAEGMPSVVVGELLALADDGCTPLLRYHGQPGSAAVRGETTVDLHAAHIGRRVVLSFEGGDVARPIVMGMLRGAQDSHAPEGAGRVQVDADGERLIVSAKDQLVLRCGAASITLTRAGKVLIQGTYVSSRSSGAQRIKGGSVQIN